MNLAHVLELEGDYHQAVTHYRSAIAVDPLSPTPHFCLALLYDQHDMFDEAEKEYCEVLQRDPLHLKALFNLGNLYLQLGNKEKAFEYLHRLVRLKSMGYEEIDTPSLKKIEESPAIELQA